MMLAQLVSKSKPSRRESIMTIMSFCRSSSSFNNSIWLESCEEKTKKGEKTLWRTLHYITQTTDGLPVRVQPSRLMSLRDQGCLRLWGPTMAQKDLLGNIHPSAPGLMLFYCPRADGSVSLTHLASLWSLYSACHKSEAYFDTLCADPLHLCSPSFSPFW